MPHPYRLPPGVGNDLKALREQSKLSQKDIQKVSGLDQSRISRIEKGEVVPSDSDINAYLGALEAPVAKKYKSYLRTEWRVLGQPAYFHPDLEALTQVERCLKQIDEAAGEEQDRSPVRGQLQMYKAGLTRLGKFLETLDHALAFVGPIGVGKSTAISHAAGLVLPARDVGLMERCALEVAGGRTTLCEVQVKRTQGSRTGLVIEPQTEEELHTLIGDLCAGLMPDLNSPQSEDQRRGVPTEVETALRNMVGLVRKSASGGDKKRVDPLKDLAGKARSRDELRGELSARMNLPRRTRVELWYEGLPGKGELEWLKKTFSDVNRGRIEDVPLPRRIDVLVPHSVVESPFEVTIVDTKGVDDAGAAIRPDIEQRLSDPRGISVLCSSFMDAPNAVAQQLLMHMRDVGETAALRERIVVLVLAQNQQALDVMEDGHRVESKEHGYEVKERDAVEQLHRLRFEVPPPFIFYNALVDDPAALVRFLNSRIANLRAAAAAQVATIQQDVSLLLADKERARAVAAQAHVLEQLAIFMENNAAVPRRSRRAHAELVRIMRDIVHPSVLWATTRRRGKYPAFDLYFRMGAAVASDARERSNKCFHGLETLIAQWKGDPNLESASGLIDSLTSNFEFWRSRFLDGCRRAGEETFRPPLLDQNNEANTLWANTENLYGSGGGYRDKVADKFDAWFDGEDREELHDALDKRIRTAWQTEVIEPLRHLCQPGSMVSVTTAAAR
jgi:transcriptional regulator with XRE-family HTH domain